MEEARFPDLALSADEYLRTELLSPVKREYVAGRVYALAGASDRHVRLAGNLYALLWVAARGGACRVYMSDMKLRVGPDRFYYPDVMVVCDPQDTEEYFKTRPCFVAEVLSPATEATDRREKLVAYQSLPTLQGYLLLQTDQRGGDYYWREDDGQWWLHHLRAGGAFHVDCLDRRLVLDEVYEGL
jgi:Uma2 family endonuclease